LQLNQNSEVLTEILTKIDEQDDEVRCFCPNCGQMVLMKLESDSCYGGPDSDEVWWHHYQCQSCSEIYDLTSRHIKPDEADLIAYNKMRFSV
jgi:DNA-directed RNA polymerase subunit RPC12/RpoP